MMQDLFLRPFRRRMRLLSRANVPDACIVSRSYMDCEEDCKDENGGNVMDNIAPFDILGVDTRAGSGVPA